MTDKELKKIIDDHQHWLKRDCFGWETMKADLHNTKLSGADLRDANLCSADFSSAELDNAVLCSAHLSGTDLRNATLCYADLQGANLSSANLCGANLWGADLRGARLWGANLPSASLWGADLRGASLEGANLHGANLRCVDLRDVNLSSANLSSANLSSANLSGVDLLKVNLLGADLCDANLCDAKNICVPIVCPDTGSFIGFKKAGAYIVMLEIPADAKRLSATGRKCRCNKAKVIEIQNIDGTKAEVDTVASNYDYDFIYSVGNMVEVLDFDEDRWHECSTGIHFFINRQEAVNYVV